MATIRGLYNGQTIVLLEPISLPPNTEVEIVIPEPEKEAENDYWNQLQLLGLIAKKQATPASKSTFVPVKVTGKPLSQTIIEERGE